MPELMARLHIDATDVGVLSAVYYFGYAGMQIPVGIMLDRFGPRKVIAGCAFVSAMGTLLFALSDWWVLALLGRFCIGAGSAAGFLGAVKTVRMVFAPEQRTKMLSWTFSIGLLGAVYGGKPVSLLIHQFGWQEVLLFMAFLCALVAGGIYFLFPESEEDTTQHVQLREALVYVFNKPVLILIGLAGGLMVGPFECFADVWGISFLQHHFLLSREDASLVAPFIYFGMTFGGPVLGFIASKMSADYVLTAICGFFMAAIFAAVLWGGQMSVSGLTVLMILVGVLSSYQVIVLSIACRFAPSHLHGLVTSITNGLNMLLGCFFHYGIGSIMDHLWTGAMQDGVKQYTDYAYTSSIALIPLCLVLGGLGFLLLRVVLGETSGEFESHH